MTPTGYVHDTWLPSVFPACASPSLRLPRRRRLLLLPRRRRYEARNDRHDGAHHSCWVQCCFHCGFVFTLMGNCDSPTGDVYGRPRPTLSCRSFVRAREGRSGWGSGRRRVRTVEDGTVEWLGGWAPGWRPSESKQGALCARGRRLPHLEPAWQLKLERVGAPGATLSFDKQMGDCWLGLLEI